MPAQLYAGPYEVWTLENGLAYAPPVFREEDRQVVLGLGEWSAPIKPPAFNQNDPELAVAPIAFDDSGTEFQFHPLVVTAQPAAAPLSPLERFNVDLSIASGGSRAVNNFWINFPLDPASLPNGAWDKTVRPAWDDEVKARIQSRLTRPRKLVVVGIIDDGIPFALESLRDDTGRTRVDYFWVQSAAAVAGTSYVPFGRELIGPDIQQLIAAHGANEDAIYNDPSAGMTDAGRRDGGDLGRNIMRVATHGAHITDSAAGFGPFDVDGENAVLIRVVAVQLPRQALVDTSGFGKEVFVLSAAKYILSRADALAKELGLLEVSVLTNLSLGVTAGPHDGQHQLEAALDEIAEEREGRRSGGATRGRTLFLLPTANSFEADTHARIGHDVWNGDGFALPWRIAPCDRTASFLELWFPDDPFDGDLDAFLNAKIKIMPPDGSAVTLGSAVTPIDAVIRPLLIHQGGRSRVIGQVSADRYRSDKGYRVMVALSPTEFVIDPAAGPGRAPAGVWTIGLDATLKPEANKVIRCHIHRDEDPAAMDNGGRQSRFERRALEHAFPDKMLVTGFGSINGWATRPAGGNPVNRIAVAGYADRSYGPHATEAERQAGTFAADYSGAGEIGVQRVDVAHRTEESPVTAGLRGSGARSNSCAYLRGTSTAAPAVLRETAIAMAKGQMGVESQGAVVGLGYIEFQDPRMTSPNDLGRQLKKTRMNRMLYHQRRGR